MSIVRIRRRRGQLHNDHNTRPNEHRTLLDHTRSVQIAQIHESEHNT